MAKVLKRSKATGGGYQRVVYRLADGSTTDAYITGFTSGAISNPGAPTVTPQGTTGAASYSYKIVAVNSSGKTAASAAGTTATGNATLSATNFNRVTWSAVTGAEYYEVHGRVGGSEGLLAVVRGALTYDDTGTATPGAAPSGANTTAAGYNINVPALKYTGVPAGGSQMVKTGVPANTTRAGTGVIIIGR